ncbi:MAG: hypothetical protein IPK74_39740 [Deltaproteobacteria bacterium]|nr:hypothetical protein [Deltaproteobacteria bacterium]
MATDTSMSPEPEVEPDRDPEPSSPPPGLPTQPETPEVFPVSPDPEPATEPPPLTFAHRSEVLTQR